jgi:ATP-dependent Clp protease ATP-binding subunit ClpA
VLGTEEIDYLLQATRSSVKKYGGATPSLSHLAAVLSGKWTAAFTEVFGDDGPEDIHALLRLHRYVGDESDVKSILENSDDRHTVLTALRCRLQDAMSESHDAAEVSAAEPTKADREDIEPEQEPPSESGWPSKTKRFVELIEPRSDLVERDDAVDLVVSTLVRSRRRIPIVLGSRGTGRTTLMGGIAAKLSAVSPSKMWRVEPGLLGPEPEGNLARVVWDCPDGDVLVIDDIDKIGGIGSAQPNGMVLRVLTAAAMLPQLKLVLVCEARQFQRLGLLADDLTKELVQVRLSPLNEAALAQVIDRVEPELETRHGVTISSALRADACLPPRAADSSAHPGLAVDRLDAAASRARVLGHQDADVSHLASVQSSEKTPLRAADLVERLSSHVRGQDHAVSTVASRLALTLARLDLRPERPDGVFLFVGPTGVGKTKLARALNLCLFGGEESLIRLDMSEYVHQWSVSRLVGPMPGYVGSTEPDNWLTTRISQTPDCVILLDEIEKAHPVVWNTFLQVFDAGRLTDSRGLTADFANTVMVMTSNLGAAAAAGPGLGFGNDSAIVERGRQKIMAAVKEAMAPELINRIDEFVIFDPLSLEAIEEIAEHELAAVKERLSANGWSVTYGPDVVHHIASNSYNPAYGARHLQRNIERGFLNLVASSEDKTVHVVVADGQLAIGAQ